MGVRRRQRGKCSGCGGAVSYDTSVPSAAWNRVVRPRRAAVGEYLCLACVVAEFVRKQEGFTATLWGKYRGRWFGGVPIEVRVGGKALGDFKLVNEENNDLRGSLSRVFDEARRALREATRPRRREGKG